MLRGGVRLLPKVTSGIPDLCNHVEVYPHYKADEELKVVCTIIKLTTVKVVWDMYKETKVKGEEICSKLEETKTTLAMIEAATLNW